MRVFERELGVEKAFLKSYEGWENVGDAGVIFYSCEFKLLSGLSRYDGYSLELAYDTGKYTIRDYGGYIEKEGEFTLSISHF